MVPVVTGIILSIAFAVATVKLVVAAIRGRYSIRLFRLLGATSTALWTFFYVVSLTDSWFGWSFDQEWWHVFYGRGAIALTAATFLAWAFLFDESYWRERAIQELLARGKRRV